MAALRPTHWSDIVAQGQDAFPFALSYLTVWNADTVVRDLLNANPSTVAGVD